MDLTRTAEKLRARALEYPETYEESPWGDRVVKVRGKIFLFCGVHEGELHISVKLPQSGRTVLREKWARPTPYGLGKSGWVSATFGRGAAPDEKRIAGFIDESYRALAPKKLVAQLGAGESAAPKAAAKKISARVMLVCHDKLRAERAVRALAERGVSAQPSDRLDDVRKKLTRLDAVIIDAGRLADEGIALAGEIDASDHAVHIFVAGIRDARMHKRAAAAATSAELFRAPPGDATVAASVAATLAAATSTR
jgi:predicted DNA-binding protein (MmcQ/YjbR family)